MVLPWVDAVNKELVEVADRYARRRVGVVLLAAVAFLAVQVIAWPRVFADGQPSTRLDWWAINVIALLGVVATGGGLLNRARVRALVQDEVARCNLQAAVRAGYWTAMILALVLYLAPWSRGLTGQQAVYLIVTGSVLVPLVVFAVLEGRALADG